MGLRAEIRDRILRGWPLRPGSRCRAAVAVAFLRSLAIRRRREIFKRFRTACVGICSPLVFDTGFKPFFSYRPICGVSLPLSIISVLNILAGELARSAKRAGNEALLKVCERSERL
jgi:hypothetical protein